jgi:hypothetical protein
MFALASSETISMNFTIGVIFLIFSGWKGNTVGLTEVEGDVYAVLLLLLLTIYPFLAVVLVLVTYCVLLNS